MLTSLLHSYTQPWRQISTSLLCSDTLIMIPNVNQSAPLLHTTMTSNSNQSALLRHTYHDSKCQPVCSTPTHNHDIKYQPVCSTLTHDHDFKPNNLLYLDKLSWPQKLNGQLHSYTLFMTPNINKSAPFLHIYHDAKCQPAYSTKNYHDSKSQLVCSTPTHHHDLKTQSVW